MNDAGPSVAPCHIIDRDEAHRSVALAIRREVLGVGPGNDLWVIIRADKETGTITCGLRAGLPDDFTPS